MQREVTVSERNTEQYQKEIFLRKLAKSKKEYKLGKVHKARDVFKELQDKYGY